MRFLFLVLSFSSFSALACPDLTGKFPVCRENGGESLSSLVEITQEEVDEVTTYTFTETVGALGRETEALVADGVARTETEETFGIEIETKAHCSDDLLIVQQKSDGEINFSTTEMIAKEGNKLIRKTTGLFMGDVVSELVVCE